MNVFAHKRLVEIQKEIPQIMVPFSIEIDIKGVVDNIKMEGLTFGAGLINLTVSKFCNNNTNVLK